MKVKNIIRVISLVIIASITGCSGKTTTIADDIKVTLIDSATNSSKLVSVLIHNARSESFAYVAGETNAAGVYAVNENEGLDFVEKYKLTDKYGGIRALTEIQNNNTDYLILGNKADNSLEVHRIESSGKLDKISSVFDSDSTFTDETVTIQDVQINNRTFIYAGGLDKGLSGFEFTESGVLKHIQSVEDNDSVYLHGIIGMSSLVIGDKTFLFTGSFFGGGLSSFQVMDNGYLKNVSNIKDDTTMFLNGAFSVNTVQLGKQSFLIAGHRHNIHYKTDNAGKHYHGDGINVFKVNEHGQMKLHSLLKDNDKILLKGNTRIEIMKVDENKAFVFIGTRDDKGIQVCTLGSDGILKPVKEIDLDYAIYNGMTVKNINGKWYLLAGAYDKNFIEMYSIEYNQ